MTHPLSTVIPMAIHLTVCPGLGALVEPLAQVLAVAPADFFAPELIAIPGEGVRSWLTWQLSQRLGGSDGIVANIEWVFPATIGRRALGLTARHDLWGVDALTWAVHGLLLNDDVPGFPHHDADLARSRAIADLSTATDCADQEWWRRGNVGTTSTHWVALWPKRNAGSLFFGVPWCSTTAHRVRRRWPLSAWRTCAKMRPDPKSPSVSWSPA